MVLVEVAWVGVQTVPMLVGVKQAMGEAVLKGEARSDSLTLFDARTQP